MKRLYKFVRFTPSGYVDEPSIPQAEFETPEQAETYAMGRWVKEHGTKTPVQLLPVVV